MELIHYAAIVMAIIAITFTWSMVYTQIRMQRTIDKLTDRLMARDYGEYKRHDRTPEAPPREQRKPISYYDDPSIETEDDDTH